MNLEHVWITKEGGQWWVTAPHGYVLDGACVRVFTTWRAAIDYTVGAISGGGVRPFRRGRKLRAAH